MPQHAEYADTRAAILAKARELFLSQGYHKTAMRTIAQAAGVSTGPLYFHFANKAEVFFHICGEAFDTLITAFRQAAASEERAGLRLRNMYCAYQGFYYHEPQLFEIMHLATDPLAGIDLPDNLQQILSHKSLELVEIMEDVIRQGVERGELRSVEPRKLALYLHSVAEGVFLSSRSGLLQRSGVGLDEMIETAINLIGLGMIGVSHIGENRDKNS
ncbi:MAG: TetR/AcrR family transcriptional regulator [Negativicutes bacterium]|nr:TetR/AcrR family transcriptional regulator [Negativicutes bacterium]